MSDGLDVIIVDADPNVCEHLSEIINRFYTWGNVFVFTSVDEAAEYCHVAEFRHRYFYRRRLFG